MQGGDGVGFFEELCAADDNMVPLDGWESFFAQFIEAKGPEVMGSLLETHIELCMVAALVDYILM